MSVKPIPDGYHTITPYLIVNEPAHLIAFLEATFDATLVYSSKGNDGMIHHAEMKIGDSNVMMGRARNKDEIMPAMLYIFTENTDKLYRKALDNGAVSVMEPSDQFYGDRNAGVRDPEGNMWWIATHIEDVPPEEIQRRMNELGK